MSDANDAVDHAFDHGLFDEDTTVLTIEDPEMIKNLPSNKYGMTLTTPVVIGFLIVGIVFMMILIYCSKAHEARKRKTQGEEAKQNVRARESLVSKAFVPRQDSEETAAFDTSVDSGGEAASATSTSSNIERLQDVECVLCSHPLGIEPEQIYESNNSKCRHCFHAGCMEKWLEFQNTCPTCNQPFLVMTV